MQNIYNNKMIISTKMIFYLNLRFDQKKITAEIILISVASMLCI